MLLQCVRSSENHQTLEWCINEENITDFINRRFDLTNGPLVRCNVTFKEHGELDSFIICLHHIAFDGASTSIFCAELVALFKQETLPPLPLQYIDYTVQMDQILDEDTAKHRQFWTDALAGFMPTQSLLPTDMSRVPTSNRSVLRALFIERYPSN